MLVAAAGIAPAQKSVTHEGTAGLQLSNGKVELVVLPLGGAFVSFVHTADAKRINPMWDPAKMAREAGGRQTFGSSRGHFLCVDGFGPVTKEEQAAGLPGHGEAHRLPWEVVSSKDTEVTFRVRLPMVQEVLTRKISMAAGEPVVLVESTLESELPFDRVILWGEHATIGAPFLKLGKTVVDASSTRCQTKPFQEQGPRTFPNAVDFDWPQAPGGVNVRVTPATDGVMNHIGCLMDPQREMEFITALNTEENLMLGYVFPRKDFAWVQHWMHYPSSKMYAWGLEFGMQPYDMTKREIVGMTPMFGFPTFRWLGAKSKISTKFLMFLTKAPAGFSRVDDVRVERGQLIVEDRTAGLKISMPASKGL